MPLRRHFLASASAIVALSTLGSGALRAETPISVVASFSILGDMVEQVGGEFVSVETLVGPNGDTHVYQPTPAAARAVQGADILVVNGLEFEGWLDRLAEAAAFDGTLVVATTGIEPIAYGDPHDDHHGDAHAGHDHDETEAHGGHDDHAHHAEESAGHDDLEHHGEDEADHDHHAEEHAGHDDHEDHGEDHASHEDHHGHDHGAFDPHAWQSLDNAVVYVDAITAALAQADPSNASAFYQNRAAYVAEIEALDAEIHTLMDALPEAQRTVVTSHDAFQYFGRDYGLTFLAPQGLSTESEASAKDVAELIEHMRTDGVSAVFLENISDSRLLEQIARETGASIGGTLYPGALSEQDGPAATYLDMMRHNAVTLTSALGS
ncbi:MAG: zinc ABC transporter substrate-binding protein [Rhodobacteraceae bacterium]|nr:zinc ABC transporter substrate-binding protein [Paracoccaceae bacterium]